MDEQAFRNFTRKMLSKKVFSCAVCEKLLKSPVMIVNDVGNVCQQCFEDKREEYEWEPLPNTSLSVMLEELSFPCSFETEGCKFELLYGNLKDHEEKCIFRTVHCILPLDNCKWKGKVKDLLAHFKEEHSKHVISSPSEVFSLEITLSKFRNIVKFLKRKNKTYILEIKEVADGRSLLHFLWDVEANNNGDLEMAIKYVGKKGQYKVKLLCLPFSNTYNEKNGTKINLDVLNELTEISGNLSITIKPNKCEFENINKQLSKQLECPVCKDTMRPPIYQCSTGHSICSSCQPKLAICPTCREKWSGARNFSLEGFTPSVQYSCMNNQFGCDTILLGNDISEHEDTCEFKMYSCPSNCTFTGNYLSVKNHFKLNHSEDLVESSIYHSTFILNSTTTETVKYFFEYGNIFKLSFRWEDKVASWITTILNSHDQKYKYYFVVTIVDSQSEHRKLIESNLCCQDPDVEDDYYIVSLAYKDLTSYAHTNKIAYSCELSEELDE